MTYESDHSRAEQIINIYFKQEGDKHYFSSPGIDGSMPISAESAEWGANTLRERIFHARILVFVISGIAGIWMFWQLIVENSLLMAFAAYVPALILGIVSYQLAIRTTLRPFKMQLLKYLRWKRRGLQRALFDLRFLMTQHRALLAMYAFLLFRGITGYFGLISWQTASWSFDFEAAVYGAIAMSVVVLVIISTALRFEPPTA